MLDTLTLRLLLGLFLSGSSGSNRALRLAVTCVAGSPGLDHPGFSTGLPPLPGSFGVCFAVHGELGPAWHARLISLILLWLWLFYPAAPYINSNRRAAWESMIPSPHLFLITVAEFSMSKQLWTVSASSPFPHVLEGPPCPPVAQLCWEEGAFFPFGNEAGIVKACLLLGLGAVPVCFGGFWWF